MADIADNLSTIFSGQAGKWDRIIAAGDLITGIDARNVKRTIDGYTGARRAARLSEAGREIVGDLNQARNRALDIVGDISPGNREPIVGRFGDLKGKTVGFQAKRPDGTETTFRYDWDPDLGAHINVTVGKGRAREKVHIFVEGPEDNIDAILRQTEKLD